MSLSNLHENLWYLNELNTYKQIPLPTLPNFQIEMVERLVVERDTSHAIVCDNLQKVYPGRDGNPDKFAVKGCSLALPRGECFGMLGPNGAGKTSFISMVSAPYFFPVLDYYHTLHEKSCYACSD